MDDEHDKLHDRITRLQMTVTEHTAGEAVVWKSLLAKLDSIEEGQVAVYTRLDNRLDDVQNQLFQVSTARAVDRERVTASVKAGTWVLSGVFVLLTAIGGAALAIWEHFR